MEKIVLVIDDTAAAAAAAVEAAEATMAEGEDRQQCPFLLRFPITAFDICLGLGMQAIMWKSLASSSSASFIHGRLQISLVFWATEIISIIIIFPAYLLKLIFHFEGVRREYFDPVRVNFFFAPWISILCLCLGLPNPILQRLPHWLWFLLMAPILGLELKLYGQWMSRGERRLSMAGNPSNLLAVVGNFVGAWLGASMGIREAPTFFFAVGMVHYLVVFITLYQRLPTNETLPKELNPVFFLFVAVPSLASMAAAAIEGSFGYGPRILYFIALFLYLTLGTRFNFFRGFRFSLAWWSYAVPLTSAAVATIAYHEAVRSAGTRTLALVLCAVAMVAVTAILIATIFRAFVARDLFPNDVDIAAVFGEGKPKSNWWHGSERIEGNIEQWRKFFRSPRKDGKVSNVSDGSSRGGSATEDIENPSPF